MRKIESMGEVCKLNIQMFCVDLDPMRGSLFLHVHCFVRSCVCVFACTTVYSQNDAFSSFSISILLIDKVYFRYDLKMAFHKMKHAMRYTSRSEQEEEEERENSICI